MVYWLTGGDNPLTGQQDYEFRRGRFADASTMYAVADAVLLPSTWEGFGLPALEAGLLQLPLLAGRRPALTEMGELGLRPVHVDQPDAVDALLDQITEGSRHDQRQLGDAFSRDGAKASLARMLEL